MATVRSNQTHPLPQTRVRPHCWQPKEEQGYRMKEKYGSSFQHSNLLNQVSDSISRRRLFCGLREGRKSVELHDKIKDIP